MKKRLFLIGAFILAVIACFAFASVDAGALSLSSIDVLGYTTSGIVSAMALPLVWIHEGKFKELSKDEFEALSDEEQKQYHEALIKHRQEKEIEMANKIKALEDKHNASEKELEELRQLKAEFNGLSAQTIKDMLASLNIHGEEIKRLRENGGMSKRGFETAIKAKFDEIFKGIDTATDVGRKKAIEHFMTKHGGSVRMEIDKATQTYADITGRDELAPVDTRIVDLPKKMPFLRQLFRTIPLSTEYYKYLRQASVVRNAQNVAVCSAITGTTKETLIVESIEVKKIKDIIDFCLDFVSDYPFMLSRIRMLITDSIAHRIDSQLLTGTGLTIYTNSISSVASEFSAANAVAVLTASVQSANLIDLLKGMKTQVVELGKQNAYDPDFAIVNKVDWFLEVDSLKDANDNYLNARGVVNVGGNWYVDGMLILFHTECAQNTCYIGEFSKGEILDRQVLNLEISTENSDNWENEIASIKGYERLNFFVNPNNANAFMKCSDIDTAVTAITAL